MGEMSDKAALIAEEALRNSDALQELVASLGGSSRRARQTAAQALSLASKIDAEIMVPYVGSFIDALNRPEAQTRWECLDVLTLLVDRVPDQCEDAILEAETALFDENSGPLRLAAMRFLCKIGSTSENRSDRTWPLIDEGIQCYHGDLEFQDMLNSVVEFSAGNLSAAVKTELGARMRFDASNSKGSLQRKAQQIVDNVN